MLPAAKRYAQFILLLLTTVAGVAAADEPVANDDLNDVLSVISDSPSTAQSAPAAETASPDAAPKSEDASASASAPVPQPAPVADTAQQDSSSALPVIPVKLKKDEPDAQAEERASARKAPTQIEEIVVTATKREQSLREIPASIAALTGAELERSGAQGVEDIVKQVPGVNFSADPVNAAQVTIRGISTVPLGNPTTGVLFGDVAFTDAYLPRVTLDPNPFDMKTVEVLKGPQGTLFGSAALNGAVRYVPNPAKYGETELRWFAQYSKVSQGSGAPMYGAALNVPWGDDFAVRVMAFNRKSPGWIDNTATNQKDINKLEQKGARGLVSWRPAENLEAKLTYVWQKTHTEDSSYADGDSGALTRKTSTEPSPSDGQYKLADGVLRYSFSDMDLISDTAWVSKAAHKLTDASTDLTGSTVPLVYLEDISHSKTISQEIRLVSTDTDSRWRWVAGAFGSSQTLFFVPEYSTALTPGVDLQSLLGSLGIPSDGVLARGDSLNILSITANAKIQELALFGDVTRLLGDSLELSIGGRLYRSRSRGSVVQQGALALLSTLPNNDAPIDASGFNPKASVMWHVTEDINIYGAVSKGFRNGGLQPGFTTPLSAKQAPAQFNSDTLWNYEVGTRTQWLDNTLHFDTTAFYIDWRDPQILLQDSAVHLPYLANVGRVKSIGVESALQWLLTWVPGLSVNASVARINTETAEAFVGQTGTTLPKGTPWPTAARWQTATTLAYTHDFGDWRAGAGVTHSYLSGAHADLEQTIPIFNYQQWDAQMSLSNTAIKWLPEASIAVNNLRDERGIANGIVGGAITRTEKVTYIQPRTILLRLSGSF